MYVYLYQRQWIQLLPCYTMFRFCFHTPKKLERERQASTAWQYSIFPAERKVLSTRFRWVWWVWHVLESWKLMFLFVFFGMLLKISMLSMSRFWSIEDCLNLFNVIECYWMSLTQIDSPVTMTIKQVSFRLILLESCTKQKPGYQCQPFPCRLGEIPRRLLFCLSREARQCSGMSIWTGAAGATGGAAVGHGYVRVCPGMYMLTLSKEV